jgi:hypothetical protein
VGEHEPIIGRQTFESVQELLKSNATGRKVKRSESGALLQGKLFDDKGNLMSPSFSTKNGVRYRFYVSSALLRGRKAEAGSVGRVASAAVEKLVIEALQHHIAADPSIDAAAVVDRHLSGVKIGRNGGIISYRRVSEHGAEDAVPTDQIKFSWRPMDNTSATPAMERREFERSAQPDPKVMRAIVRARRWATALSDGSHASVEELAKSARLHPKVVRQELRFAFIAPDILEALLNGCGEFTLRDLRKVAALNWRVQQIEISESHHPRS